MNLQPEQLLRQLKLLQLQKKEIDLQITEKKMILEKYYLEGIIMSSFSIDGVKVTRKRKPEKWEYSNTTNQFRKDISVEWEAINVTKTVADNNAKFQNSKHYNNSFKKAMGVSTTDF